jgi:hypothetical protein
MFVTQKHVSRREVLKGVGATIALPFLDAMVPVARSRMAGRLRSRLGQGDRARLDEFLSLDLSSCW